MAAVLPYVKNPLVFGPEATRAMSVAFDEVKASFIAMDARPGLAFPRFHRGPIPGSPPRLSRTRREYTSCWSRLCPVASRNPHPDHHLAGAARALATTEQG
jgi:hypothetical protein